MRLALAQVSSDRDPSDNLDLVEKQVIEAAAQGAELVIFPEAMMRAFGHDLTAVAEPVSGPWVQHLSAIADQHDVWVAAGMFTPGADGKVANTLVLTGRGVRAAYTKIHLYDAYGFRESDTVVAGETPVLVDLGGVRVGLVTCYDLRFPGLFTRLADDGVQLVLVAASWGAGPGKVDQWRLLTRARALDATVFVAACGQSDPAAAGVDARPGAPTGVGHSVVVGPDGSVLAEAGVSPELLVVDIDPIQVDRVREQLPVLRNRRF